MFIRLTGIETSRDYYVDVQTIESIVNNNDVTSVYVRQKHFNRFDVAESCEDIINMIADMRELSE